MCHLAKTELHFSESRFWRFLLGWPTRDSWEIWRTEKKQELLLSSLVTSVFSFSFFDSWARSGCVRGDDEGYRILQGAPVTKVRGEDHWYTFQSLLVRFQLVLRDPRLPSPPPLYITALQSCPQLHSCATPNPVNKSISLSLSLESLCSFCQLETSLLMVIKKRKSCSGNFDLMILLLYSGTQRNKSESWLCKSSEILKQPLCLLLTHSPGLLTFPTP